MDDMTLGVIYAVKHPGDVTAKQAVIQFLSNYTDTPKEHYSDSKLASIIRQCFIDYIKTARVPAVDVFNYFQEKERRQNFKMVFPVQYDKYYNNGDQLDDDTEGIISAFRLARVKDDEGNYMNGFREVEHATES